MSFMRTLENRCTRQLQPSRGGCSQQVLDLGVVLLSGMKNRYLSLYISHLEVSFAVYCHLHIQLHACLIRDM